MTEKARPLFDLSIVKRAVKDAFTKLNPRQMAKNPVMFVVEVGSLLTTLLIIRDLIQGHTGNLLFTLQVTLWLWFTVLFANFAEAMAEGGPGLRCWFDQRDLCRTGAVRCEKSASPAPERATVRRRA